MVLDSQIIDKVYSSMLSIGSGSSYHFGELSGNWGNRSNGDWDRHYSMFRDEMTRLAREIPIKYHGKDYYMFDGEIYRPVPQDLLCMAYDQFLGHFRISSMYSKRVPRQEWFLSIIKAYNILIPRAGLVAFSNGVLDLDNNKIGAFGKRGMPLFHEGFSSEFHVIHKRSYPYSETARCRKWYNFIHEVLPDKNQRLVLQMFLGLGLISRSTVYNAYDSKDSMKVELCLLLLGSGANGKSTIYDTAVGIFGKERISGLDYDDLTAQGDEGMRARALLGEAIFNWSSDSDQRTFARKRLGVFKRIVSGESVTERKIGEDVRERLNVPFLIFNLNELPHPEESSLGLIRRLQYIYFDVTIPKERQNPALSRELVEEYPGIFNWILRGAKELRRRRFVFPDSGGQRKQMLLTQLKINPVLAWLNCYLLRPDMLSKNETYLWIPAKVMMKSLEKFCDDNNVDMVSKQKFGATMNKYKNGFVKQRFADGVRYQVYGCTEDRLREEFVIDKEDMAIEYIADRDTFILEDD